MRLSSSVPGGPNDTLTVEKSDTISQIFDGFYRMSENTRNDIDTLIWEKRNGLNRERDFQKFLPHLTDVIIRPGLKEIGARTFEHCHRLLRVSLPAGLRSIGKSAFAYTALQEVSLPETIASLGPYTFRNASVSKLTVPKNAPLTELPCSFAEHTPLTEFVCPDALKIIERRAFCDCTALKSVVMNKGLRTICGGAFRNTALEALVLPSTLEYFRYEQSGMKYVSRIEIVAGNEHFSTPGGNMLVDNTGVLIGVAVSAIIAGELRIPDGIRFADGTLFPALHGLKRLFLPDSFELPTGPLCYFFGKEVAAVEVSSSHPAVQSVNGILYNKDMTTLRFFPAASPLKNVVIPASVCEIPANAFSYADLHSLVFAGPVRLQLYAFHNSHIRLCVFCNDVSLHVYAEEPHICDSQIEQIEFNKDFPAGLIPTFRSRISLLLIQPDSRRLAEDFASRIEVSPRIIAA